MDYYTVTQDTESELKMEPVRKSDVTYVAIVTLSTYCVFMTADSIFRRLEPKFVSEKKTESGGSRHLKALSCPLVILDSVIIAVLIVCTLYSAASTNITLYPLMYPPNVLPPTVIICVLSTNLGRYFWKLQLSLHNRRKKILYPACVCIVNCAFLIGSLSQHLALGFCLIGIVAETPSVLKFVHYLPTKLTTRSWCASLVAIKFLLTFLVKGVLTMVLASLATVIQFNAVADHFSRYGVTWLFPLTTFFAVVLASLNFVHMVTFTTFTMEYCNSLKRRRRNFKDLGIHGNTWFKHNTPGAVRPGLNLNSNSVTVPTKNPISYHTNTIDKKPVKEKNTNMNVKKQQCVVVNINGEPKIDNKENRSAMLTGQERRRRGVLYDGPALSWIQEETASQISDMSATL